MDPITLGILAVAVAAGFIISRKPPVTADMKPPISKPSKASKLAAQTALKKKACAAADSYMATLNQYGLPRPPNWDALTCDEKIAACASIIGGPGLAGMAEAAAAAAIIANYQSTLSEAQKAAQAADHAVQQVTNGVSDVAKGANDAYKSAAKKLGF